jgi:hypothetical protein
MFNVSGIDVEPRIVWSGTVANTVCRVVVQTWPEDIGLGGGKRTRVIAEVRRIDAMGEQSWREASTVLHEAPGVFATEREDILDEMACAAATSDLGLLAAAALLDQEESAQ